MISCVYNLWPNSYSETLDIFLIHSYNRALPIVQCSNNLVHNQLNMQDKAKKIMVYNLVYFNNQYIQTIYINTYIYLEEKMFYVCLLVPSYNKNVIKTEYIWNICKTAYGRYMLKCQPLAGTEVLRTPTKPFWASPDNLWRKNKHRDTHSVYYI